MENLIQDWKDSGIKEGDTVLIHSSIKRTLKRNSEKGVFLTPEDILNSFLEAVGDSGTLVFPLFNFDFTKKVAFDIRTTPSHMGALTEAARKHPSAIRTGHPIYSFAVIGARSDEFKGIDNFSGYGSDSPFAVLHKIEGKIAVLDLPDQNSMTFYHYVEEMHNVDYRYHKVFNGSYTDASGYERPKDYGLFVRDIEKGVQTHVNPTGEMLWDNGIYTGSRPNEHSGLRVALAQEVYDFTSELILSDRAINNLYRIEQGV